ncbi:MAG TPA: hypothetical protein VGM77_06085 [Gemmatimonadales bacterium]|jgi:hypothetical protein
MLVSLVVAALIYSGWVLARAWDRRSTAARDLHDLGQEARALAEQNALLAQELADLASHRLPDRGHTGDAVTSDAVLLRQPRST